jgi:glycogen(starch) synthase
MKILLWVPEYPPHNVWGGWAVFEAIANEYTKLWHEVMVIYWYYKSITWFEKIKIYSENEIKFIQVPLLPTPWFVPFLKTVLPTWFRNTNKISNIIKEFNPDVAHIHWYWLFFVNQLAKICQKLSIKYIYTLHWAPVSADKKWWIIKYIYDFYKKTLWRNILDNADKITAVSQYTIDNFTEFQNYKEKIQVIPNGIYPEEFTKKIDYNIYDQYNLPEWSTIYLSIWRIERRKWHDKFIKMIPKLVDSWIDVRYFIAGEDNWYKETLDKLAKKLWVSDRIYYLWFISWDNKLSMLQNANYVIFPSEKETFWLVTLEAIVSWTIPIINNIWWFVDIIEDWVNGIVIDFDNINDYKKIINVSIDINKINTINKYNRIKIANSYLNLI